MGEAGMKILITGAHGFVGRNLTETLKAVRDGKDRTRGLPTELELLLYTRQSPEGTLEAYCAEADFVFHLAGVNRPETEEEFLTGNRDLTARLLSALEKAGNPCPVLLTSSIQALRDNPYGRSKLAGEDLVRSYGARTGAKTLIYRLPNLFGKWCRPNYNSVVATFCYNLSHDLPIQVNDPSTQLELLYIDDLMEELLDALEGHPHRCDYQGLMPLLKEDGKYCYASPTHQVTLGEIVELLESFKAQPKTLVLPEIPPDSFAKKLYSTFLSYLPQEKVAFPLKMNVDERGSFTELLKTRNCGQFSVNISKPGITKGQHWHNSKWEFFVVVSGHGLIQERKIGSEEILEFEVDGDHIQAVHMLPGYTHNIINLSDTENLVTVMWANEQFDPGHPDTFGENV